ncbi:MAG: hypothetical protein LBS57_11675 [Treponema sp.]|jgi:hypothetical protein|nr:hypothetical protein [Treponema sp.]
MSAFVSRRSSLLILLAGLCSAGAAALLLHYFLAGPLLGPVYDALLVRRPAPPVSREILLIDTGEIIEPGDLFSVLMILAETDAANLVVDVPVLGSSSGKAADEEEIRRRFGDEYNVLGGNIRNLFEAIRTGSIQPLESGRYVENLVELAERGRDRLIAALVRRDTAASVKAARAAAVFGAVLEAEDLRAQSAAASAPDTGWYARPRPDRDGRLRRIAPLEGDLPHIVYQALRPRWAKAALELEERGPVLTLRPAVPGGLVPAAAAVPASADTADAAVSAGGKPAELRFSLDGNANILVEGPRGNDAFRRVALEKFRAYDEADQALRRLLKNAEALGVYSGTRPERIPYILYDYAEALKEELLSAAGGQTAPDSLSGSRRDWTEARREYFNSLDEFLYGPAEMSLVGGYEEIIATEKLGEEGLEKLRNLRDGLIRSFVEMREKHRELTELRSALSEALASSFCIMGTSAETSAVPLAAPGPAEGAVESSLILANALLTGRHIIPGETRYVLFWSLLIVSVILIGIHIMRPPALLVSGFAASALCGAGFGWSFIISAYWIDPFIPAGACLAGTLVMFCLSSLIISRGTRRFRLAYGPAVNRACLKQLIRTGQPSLSETICARAVVIAVKNAGLLKREDQEEPILAAGAAAEFRNTVSRTFKKAGAAILGYEGDTVLVCFGSPLERIYLGQIKTETQYGDDLRARSNHHPAVKAMGFITELLQPASADFPVKSWRFGVDCGECAFSWSEETGYTASGRPLVRARILSSLASRYRAKVLIADSVRERLNQPVRKLHTLGEQDGGGKEYFYEPLIRK